MSKPTHIIRFIANEDNRIHIGQLVDTSRDIGLDSVEGKEIKAYKINGTIFSGEVTKQVYTVKQLLSPVSMEDCNYIRCLGLNYRDHAKVRRLLILQPAQSNTTTGRWLRPPQSAHSFHQASNRPRRPLPSRNSRSQGGAGWHIRLRGRAVSRDWQDWARHPRRQGSRLRVGLYMQQRCVRPDDADVDHTMVVQ